MRRCYNCGEGPVQPTAKAGRTRRYKSEPVMEIPADVEIPTCDNCGAEWVDGDTAERIDAALEIQYQARTDKLIEALADQEHDRWSKWMKYLFGRCENSLGGGGGDLVIPSGYVSRWSRQVETSYSDLSEQEKESDRKEARNTIETLKHFREAESEIESGAHLGVVREWIKWHAKNGERVTWGSNEILQVSPAVSVSDLERLAQRIKDASCKAERERCVRLLEDIAVTSLDPQDAASWHRAAEKIKEG